MSAFHGDAPKTRKIRPNQSAFPHGNYNDGADIRTYVACHTLAGLCSNLQWVGAISPETAEGIADTAVTVADALIARLRQGD